MNLEPYLLDADLVALYDDFDSAELVPLWTQTGDLMPTTPRPHAIAHRWRWSDLYALAERAGRLVPVGRGGERRAIALANPGLCGAPYATPTLWAAIQYLNAHESAPAHRHSQHAFRFVIEGEGVATVVNADVVAMRRGDFLPQAGWNWHWHVNHGDAPMAWIDGLDIPLQRQLDTTFFEPGNSTSAPAEIGSTALGPSQSERLWGHPALAPLSQLGRHSATPLLAYRWEHTDRALTAQLEMEADGLRATVGPGHAAVRFVNPSTGSDVLPTIRAEMHRLGPGAIAAGREVGSSVFQVFDGRGHVRVENNEWSVERGDLFVVPAWQQLQVGADGGLDLFRFSDTPVVEKLGLQRDPMWGAC